MAMELDTAALSTARAIALNTAREKLDAAKMEGDMFVGEASFRDALSTASQALVNARRANDVQAKLEALEIVARCNIYLGDLFAANLAVTDELAMIQRTQDKDKEVRCLLLAAEVHLARGDGIGAVDTLKKALEMVKGTGDKAMMAKALSQMSVAKVAVGKASEAVAPAEDAEKLFQEFGDEAGAREARRQVNVVFAERKMLDKAPDRAEALRALEALKVAVGQRSSMAWGSAMEALHKTGAFVQADIDEVVKGALESDRYNNSIFLEAQGALVKGSGTDVPVFLLNEYPRTTHYLGMRVGGLGYGPRFRCCHGPYRRMVVGDLDSLGSAAVLQTAEEADDWEKDLCYHPGTLDSMLQSSGAASLGF